MSTTTTAGLAATPDTLPDSPLLSITDLSVTYRGSSGTFTAVRGVSFDIAPGERVALVGESGSGKTTIGRTILGLHRSSVSITGSVRLDGQELTRQRARAWRKIRGRRVSLVPQDPLAGLNPVHPIGAQVAEVLLRHRLAGRAQAKELAIAALEEAGLDGAADRYGAYPHELSGGQRQRVLIAIASIARPELIVADEPTSALDVTVQRRILDQLDVLTRDHGTAMLLVTHDLGVATDRADRVVVLEAGRVVEILPGRDLLTQAREPYTQRLAAAAPSLGSRPLVSPPPEVPDGAARPVLEVRDLALTFPGRRGLPPVTALDGVSLSVAPGESVGVVGESGSGKTTLSRVLLGLQVPQAGTVEVLGRPRAGLGTARERWELHRAVQPVFQDPYSSLDPSRTIEWSIGQPLRALTDLDRTARRARVTELLDQVALPQAFLRRKPRELSGGQLQRVAIARALAVSPRLLVCDEPVSSLDVSVQAQVLTLLARLQEEQGLAMVFISHDLAVVRLVCHRVMVLRRGTVVEEGEAGAVFENPQHPYTRELVAAVPGRREVLAHGADAALTGSLTAGASS